MNECENGLQTTNKKIEIRFFVWGDQKETNDDSDDCEKTCSTSDCFCSNCDLSANEN